MTAPWRKRWIEQPHLKSPEVFRYVGTKFLNNKQSLGYLRNCRIYSDLARDIPIHLVASRYKLSVPAIHKIMNRALAHSDGSGSIGRRLIPYARVNKGKRRKALLDPNSVHGKTYCLSDLFDKNPHIKEALDNALYLDVAGVNYGRNLGPSRFHRLFIFLCRKNNMSELDYPLCDATAAKESCRLYYHRRRREFESPRAR